MRNTTCRSGNTSGEVDDGGGAAICMVVTTQIEQTQGQGQKQRLTCYAWTFLSANRMTIGDVDLEEVLAAHLDAASVFELSRNLFRGRATTSPVEAYAYRPSRLNATQRGCASSFTDARNSGG